MLSIATVMKQAVSHHQKGHIQQSIALYNAVLQHVPDHADANHLRGLAAHQQGQHQIAVEYILRAIQKNNTVATYHNNLGAALRSLSQPEAAIRAFRHATVLQSNYAPAWNNLINTLKGCDDHSGVLETLDAWVERSNHSTAALQCRAAHRYAAGDLVGSLGDHRQIVQNNPNAFQPLLKFGILAHELGDDEQALAAFERARDLHSAASTLDSATTRSKLEHDVDQLTWLMVRGKLSTDWSSRVRAHRHVAAQLFSDKTVSHDCLALPPSMHKQLGEQYCKPHHIRPCPAQDEPVLSDSWDGSAVEVRYQTQQPGITWIDGLLRPEALSQLYAFCMESTIWNKYRYNGGYIGSAMSHGFCNGLLLQIARELRQRLPTLLRGRPLRQMWAFKYDQQRSGIGVHADAAAVNVNFWVTPDSANLNPAGGGLRVWRKCAPMDWNFDAFNRQPAKLLDWVHTENAEEVVVPYRANRAVIFNSNLIHETDAFHFAPGYENRRINITMLFGERGG